MYFLRHPLKIMQVELVHTECYLPKVETKDYNIIIIGKKFLINLLKKF